MGSGGAISDLLAPGPEPFLSTFLPVSLEKLDSELRWNHDPLKRLSRQQQKEVAMSMSDFTIAMTVTATIFAALMLAAAL